jgi:hypothetical protein
LLKKISTAYHRQLEDSRDPSCLSPFQKKLTQEQISEKLKSGMRSLIK